MRNLLRDLKAFALGGNMFDLALGFIIGTAFAALVESLAKNVIMQFVAAIFGQPDFSRFKWTLNGFRDRLRRLLDRSGELPVTRRPSCS